MSLLNIVFIASQALILFFMLSWGIKRDRRFLFLVAFVIPLQSLSIDLGVLVAWYKIVFLVAVAAMLLGRFSFRIKSSFGMRQLFIFLVYAVFLTLISAFSDSLGDRLFMLGEALGWGPFQAAYRFIVQLITTILVWGVILIPVWFLKTREDLSSLLNGYIWGNILSALVGFYQVIAGFLQLPGYDFNWFFGLGKGLFRDTSAARSTGITLYRLGGLSGEPKHAGAFFLSALALLVVIDLFAPDNFGVKRLRLKLGILLIGIILTFSTGTWLALPLVIGLCLVVAIIRKEAVAWGYIVFIGICIIGGVLIFGSSTLQNLVDMRLFSRVDDGIVSLDANEPKDSAFIAYFLDQPLNSVFGVGTGMLDFRLIPYTDQSYLNQGGTITPAYFFTRTLGEFGLVGLVILLGLFAKWYKIMGRSSDVQWGRIFLGVSVSVGFAATSSVALTGYLLVMSALVVYAESTSVPQRKRLPRGYSSGKSYAYSRLHNPIPKQPALPSETYSEFSEAE